jgi:hypothetical protein
MTELETQIWNTVHNWCDAQSNGIPDQNRRHLMDEIKALVLSHVSGSVYLTENQIAELAGIGSQYLYLGAMDEGRISYGGIMEILKRYEELRKTDR